VNQNVERRDQKVALDKVRRNHVIYYGWRAHFVSWSMSVGTCVGLSWLQLPSCSNGLLLERASEACAGGAKGAAGACAAGADARGAAGDAWVAGMYLRGRPVREVPMHPDRDTLDSEDRRIMQIAIEYCIGGQKNY